MAALIDGDMKRMLAPEYERRYFALYHAMLERKMPYMFISPEFSHVDRMQGKWILQESERNSLNT